MAWLEETLRRINEMREEGLGEGRRRIWKVLYIYMTDNNLNNSQTADRSN